MDKIYIVKYCGNEFDDLGYESPYPIYYSLDYSDARNFFENQREQAIKHLNEFLKNNPKFQNNEDYQFAHNDNDYFEYYMGNWFYEYKFEISEFGKDLRYEKSNS